MSAMETETVAAEIIDAHHHLWRYNPPDYPWIDDSMAVLRRDYLLAELVGEVQEVGIAGTIAVQARQSLVETAWLLSLANSSPIIRGVVGWAPIASSGFAADLEWLCTQPKLKGLRHVLQDEADDNYILRPDFNRGIARLRNTSLVYDVLILNRHLDAAIKFVDAHPQQVFVLDHAAKPRIRDGAIEPWRSNLVKLSRRSNVYCKISGLITEADWESWTIEDLRPYVECVLESFGASRTMFGSDWPVCQLAATYPVWFATFQQLINELSVAEKEQVVGRTAKQVYRLP